MGGAASRAQSSSLAASAANDEPADTSLVELSSSEKAMAQMALRAVRLQPRSRDLWVAALPSMRRYH